MNRFLDEWDMDPLKYLVEESTFEYPYVIVDFEVEKSLTDVDINFPYNKSLKSDSALEEGNYACRAFTTVKLLATTPQISSDAIRFMKTNQTSALSGNVSPPHQQEKQFTQFHPFIRSIIKRIGPIFDFPSSLFIDFSKKLALMQNPILLSINNSQSSKSSHLASCFSHILSNNLSECASFLQATFLTIDARQIMHYEVFSKAAQESKSEINTTTSRQRSSMSNYSSAIQSIQSAIASDARNISLSNEVIDVILRNAPCILLVESLDLFIMDSTPALPDKTSSMSSEERFFQSFSIFLKDLYSGMIADSGNSIRSESGDDVIDKVVVFAGTAAESTMKPSSKAIFSSIIPYNHVVDVEEVTEDIHKQINHSKDGGGIIFDDDRTSHEFSRVIAQQVSNAFGGATAAKLVNDFRSSTLRNRRANAWLSNLGHLSSGKDECLSQRSQRDRNHHSDCFDTTNRDGNELQNIIAKKKDIRKFLASRRESIMASTAESSQTFAIHWSDIGGLDSVRQEILDVLELPFQYPELFSSACPRRQGVLLYGPPGTVYLENVMYSTMYATKY